MPVNGKQVKNTKSAEAKKDRIIDGNYKGCKYRLF